MIFFKNSIVTFWIWANSFNQDTAIGIIHEQQSHLGHSCFLNSEMFV